MSSATAQASKAQASTAHLYLSCTSEPNLLKYQACCVLAEQRFEVSISRAKGPGQKKTERLKLRRQLYAKLCRQLGKRMPEAALKSIRAYIEGFSGRKATRRNAEFVIALKPPAPAKQPPAKQPPAQQSPTKQPPAKQSTGQPTAQPVELSPVRLHSDYSHSPARPHDLFFAVTAAGLPQKLHFWGRTQSQEHGEALAIHRARGLCRLLGLTLPIYCDEEQIAKKLGVQHIRRDHAAHKTVHQLCSTARRAAYLLKQNRLKPSRKQEMLEAQAPEQMYIARLTLHLGTWSAIRYGRRTTLFGPDGVRIASWRERA